MLKSHVAPSQPQSRLFVGYQSAWKQYLWALLLLAVVAGLNALFLPWIGYHAVGLTGLVAVLLIGVYLGRGPALLAATLSALFWNYLFIPPRLTFVISNPEDIILVGLYFLIAIFTGNLTARIRAQEKQAHYNADRTLALYTLVRETATALTIDDILQTVVTQVGQIFDAEVALLLPRAGKLLAQPHPSSTLTLDAQALAIARWVFEQGKPAGRFTDAWPAVAIHYLPLLATGKTVGVMALRIRQAERLGAEQEVLLETFANQSALVIERELLDEAAQQAAMLRESERLYTALLNSISHELRTPLATIAGAASSLLNPQTQMNETARTELTHDIQAAAERLNRLVENLLDMSRLDAGRLQLKLEWCDVSDMISVAVKRLAKDFAHHPLSIEYQPNLPLAPMDFRLMEQVLVNLLDNACTYTPAGTPIKIAAALADECLCISITDAGPGIPVNDLARIFDKFYRVPGTATGGTGLGLSICRGLVEAHNGRLAVEPVASGGVRFIIRLPIGSPPPPAQEAAL
ncbi:MAG: DUF4118 domain-containing protein [Caldilineaceae bacterium]